MRLKLRKIANMGNSLLLLFILLLPALTLIIIYPVEGQYLSVDITYQKATTYVGQPIEIVANVKAGNPPFTYQWYTEFIPQNLLDDPRFPAIMLFANNQIVRVEEPGANSSTFNFDKSTPGTYNVILYMTDSLGDMYASTREFMVVLPLPVVIDFKDISAEIQPHSPTYNMSYTGDIPLNITIHYASQTKTNSSVISYQKITCQYQIDNGSWDNANFVSASKQNVWYDPTFRGFWNSIDCNYYDSLQELSNGRHSLNVTLTPPLQYSYFVLSNGTSPMVRIENRAYDALANSTVDFYVYGNYDTQTTTQNQGVPLFPTTLVVITVSIIAAVIAFTLLLFRRHRKTTKALT